MFRFYKACQKEAKAEKQNNSIIQRLHVGTYQKQPKEKTRKDAVNKSVEVPLLEAMNQKKQVIYKN